MILSLSKLCFSLLILFFTLIVKSLTNIIVLFSTFFLHLNIKKRFIKNNKFN